jgi:hypothetical protein
MARTSGGGGSGGAGGQTVRKFPFAYNTPSLDTEAALYTPTIGDILYDGWIEVDTAWNGTTPKGDIVIQGAIVGLFYNAAEPLDMTSADATVDTGMLSSGGSGPSLQATNNFSAGAPTRNVPAKFVTADPVCVVVSQDGTVTTQSTVLADSAPTSPLVVTAILHKNFVFTGTAGGGTPETFTLTNGTYTGIAQIVAAMRAATGSVSGEAFATLVNVTVDSTKILLTDIVDSGIAGNGDTITVGATDASAALGFTGNPDTFAGGTGGNPGSSTGAAILYLVTATPTT